MATNSVRHRSTLPKPRARASRSARSASPSAPRPSKYNSWRIIEFIAMSSSRRSPASARLDRSLGILGTLFHRARTPAFLPSVELFRHGLPLGALHQRDVGHGMTVLQRGHDADDAVALVLLHGLGRSRIEGPLRFGHRLALRLRRREVAAAGDRRRLRDLPGLVIDYHLGERVTLHRVDRELQLAVLDLVLRGDRLAFFGAGRQPALQRDLGVFQRLRELGMLLVAIVLGPSYWHGKEPRHEECLRDRRLSHLFLLQRYDVMDVLRLLLQHRVEPIEDRHPALEQLVIVRRDLNEAVDRQVHARGLVTGELAVVQVGLVHDLGHRPDPAILEAEPPDQGLERAVLAVMAEVRAENIKRDPLAGGVGRVGKGKLCLRIAEALDEPGGGDAVDMGSRARDPRAAAGRQRRSVTPAPRAWPRLRGAQTLGRRLPQTASALPGRRLQVIDGLDAVQLTLQAIELTAELRDRSAVVRLVAIEVPEEIGRAHV